jgi:Tol biopolymer transport system component
LQRVVHRCLEKNPEQRFQSASDLAFALDALSEHSGNTAALSNKESRRISKLWAVAAMLVVAAVAVLVFRFRTQLRPEQKHEPVERQLTANPPESTISSTAISRDGRYLAYAEFSKSLYMHLLAVDSGEVRQVPLSAPYQPVDWFPDGSHLLLVSGTAAGDLWKMSTWDFSLRKLWGGLAWNVAISPDGSRIAFVKDGKEGWLMGADGEEPHKILADDAQGLEYIAWSPTGQRLAYVQFQGTLAKPEVTIETCDLAGGARTVVLSDPRLYLVDAFSGIAWLPDGRVICSILSLNGSDSDLWAIRVDPSTGKQTGNATCLVGWKNFQAQDPQASADGKHLMAARTHTEIGIYIGDLAFGNKAFTPRRFALDDWYNVITAWTKDSKAILFHSKRNGRWAIFKQNIDAKTPETLIAGSENYFKPKLCAQGALLYSATASPNRFEPGDTTIRLMSTPEQGGARSTLMMGRYEYACGSSPSSSCVVSELKDRQLVFFHLAPVKGKGDEITNIAGYQSVQGTWDLSPDG